MSAKPAMICCDLLAGMDSETTGAETYRERALADGDQGSIDDGDALSRGLEGFGLLRDQLNAVGDLLRSGGCDDGCHKERGTNDKGAEGNHLGSGGCLLRFECRMVVSFGLLGTEGKMPDLDGG